MNNALSDVYDSVFGEKTPRITTSQFQTKTPTLVQNISYATLASPTEIQSSETPQYSAALISAIKGLLDLTS